MPPPPDRRSLGRTRVAPPRRRRGSMHVLDWAAGAAGVSRREDEGAVALSLTTVEDPPRIVAVENYERLLGFEKNEMIGRDVMEFYTPAAAVHLTGMSIHYQA